MSLIEYTKQFAISAERSKQIMTGIRLRAGEESGPNGVAAFHPSKHLELSSKSELRRSYPREYDHGKMSASYPKSSKILKETLAYNKATLKH
jgi:hypothetical protein